MKTAVAVLLLTGMCFAGMKREATYDHIKNETAVEVWNAMNGHNYINVALTYTCSGKSADCHGQDYVLELQPSMYTAENGGFFNLSQGNTHLYLNIDGHPYDLGALQWFGHYFPGAAPGVNITERLMVPITPEMLGKILAARNVDGEFSHFKLNMDAKRISQLHEALTTAPPKWKER